MLCNERQTKKETDSMENQLIELCYDVDDFCKEFESTWQRYLLPNTTNASPTCTTTLSEVMTIGIFFHLSHQRTFKGSYKSYISTTLKDYFPKRLRYKRFTELMQSALVPLVVYTLHYRKWHVLRYTFHGFYRTICLPEPKNLF